MPSLPAHPCSDLRILLQQISGKYLRVGVKIFVEHRQGWLLDCA